MEYFNVAVSAKGFVFVVLSFVQGLYQFDGKIHHLVDVTNIVNITM